MNWNKKVEMIKYNNEGQTELFNSFVESNMEEIVSDTQAVEMFLECISVSEVNVRENMDLYSKFIVPESVLENLPFRSLIRHEALRTILEGDVSCQGEKE